MMTVRKSASIAAGLALALALAGCSSSSNTETETPTGVASVVPSASGSSSATASSSVGAANAASCTSSAALSTELGDLRSLVEGGSVTTEALQSQKQALSNAGDQAKADAQALDQAVQAEVAAAQTAFKAAIDTIPADETGATEAAAYVAAAAVFDKALEAIDNQVCCP